jgi:Uma2 family endonuclease
MAAKLDSRPAEPHFVLTGVSWSYYERTLEELAEQNVRVAYLDGAMELMSPLPEHEGIKKAIADLVAALAMGRQIRRKSFGSTTFRREEKAAGSEPDECYYFGEIDSVSGMKRFDPRVHRPPDLWIEIDLFSASVPREPIYARLGVPEVWRYDSAGQLAIRLLTPGGSYVDSKTSRVLPFLPIAEFAQFIPRMIEGDETAIMLEVVEWARRL